jgi:hypothetical protein
MGNKAAGVKLPPQKKSQNNGLSKVGRESMGESMNQETGFG